MIIALLSCLSSNYRVYYRLMACCCFILFINLRLAGGYPPFASLYGTGPDSVRGYQVCNPLGSLYLNGS